MARDEKAPTGGRKGSVQGEGDYEAARAYRRETEDFIAKNKKDIPRMAEDAEKALEGPQGPDLEKAEERGKSKARR